MRRGQRNCFSFAITCYLEIAFFYLAAVQPCFASDRAAIAMGSRTVQGQLLPTNEITAQANVTAHMLSIAANTSHLGSNYATHNLHGAGTTQQNIFWAASGCGHEAAVVFHVGHGGWNYVFGQQQWCIEADGGTLVYDMEIYPYSVCKNVFFTFLWSCEQGDVIGGNHLFGVPYGMPHAWRHSYTMSSNGYTNPWGDGLFIGFQGVTPVLTYPMAGAAHVGEQFVWEFYSHAFGEGNTVSEALDYATWHTFPESSGWDSFDDCILYTGYEIPETGHTGRMVVYGYASLELHKYGVTGGGGGGYELPY